MKENKEVRFADSLKFHWRHAMKYPKLVWASFIIGPLSIILERYIAPLFIAAILTAIQQGSANIENSGWLVAGYALVQLFGTVIGYRLNLYAMWSVQVDGARDIGQEAYEAISRHSLRFHNNRFAGSLISQVNKATGSFFSFWWMVIYDVLFVVVSILATLIGLAILSWPMAIVLAIVVVVFSISAFYGTRFIRPRHIARSKAYSKVSGALSDSIGNMAAVKIESKEKLEKKRLLAITNNAVEKDKIVRQGVMSTSTITSFIVATARTLALLIAILSIQSQSINAGAVYLIITYTLNLLGELANINNTLRTSYQISGDTEELLEIINTPSEIVDKSNKKLKVNKGSVSLQNITFQHSDAATPLFSNLNIDIPAGQKVGVVGVSGSGKTTLTKLLLRLEDVNKGSIKIDGQDISQITQKSLHDAISYVQQEPILFHRSLKENISYARPKASEKDIIKAAKDAQALSFIEKLEKGFETEVGERGVKLSGGQRQRIAIARAILKNAPILILDEATSALDSESEHLIQKALEKLMKGRTSIVIAHRLSTIAKLDRVIVMKDGEVVEDGSHQSLLTQGGTYAKLWEHQTGDFIEEDR